MVKYAAEYMRYSGNPQEWLEKKMSEYLKEEKNLSPPQLPNTSWIIAGIYFSIAFDIVTNKPVKKFSEFYLTTVK